MSFAPSLEAIHRLLTRRWARVPGDNGRLSYNEYAYLRVIEATMVPELPLGEGDENDPCKQHGGIHMGEVALTLGVRAASASTMLRRLEDEGYVSREPCPVDSRAQHIMLTDLGQRLLEMHQKLYDDVAMDLADALDEDEVQQLSLLLDKALTR